MEREYVHNLIDLLNPDQFEAVSRLVEVMADPMKRALAAAPVDDEPITEEDIRSLREGELELAQGKVSSMEEIMAEFGLTMEDLHQEIAQLDEAVPGRMA